MNTKDINYWRDKFAKLAAEARTELQLDEKDTVSFRAVASSEFCGCSYELY